MNRFTMVCFDVSDEHRLRRVANELENFGQRVQRSVFECWLDDKQLFELKCRLAKMIDPGEDHVRYYPFCSGDLRGILIDGPGSVTTDIGYTIT
ncbi:MAG: CRISPR-associated endonuclease Cas2 [gamma proteobacterium symbiont of Ctena orbiculata]|nr:MAG: CRISPR-associated endonuclease Cas2 [gamma proteobacterium symbiont of Ctena orbiculata]